MAHARWLLAQVLRWMVARLLPMGVGASLALGLACSSGGGPPAPPPAPAISAFTAGAATVASGEGTTLTATFTNGTGSVDHGLGAAISGAALATGPLTIDTTFTLTVTGSGGAPATRSLQVSVLPPAAPIVTAVAGPVSTGATGLAASVPAQAGCTFQWTIEGGTFSGNLTAASGPAVTFSAGAPGNLRLSCVAVNVSNRRSAPGLRELSVVALPAIASFTSASGLLSAGQSTQLVWAATGAQTLSLSPAPGDVTGRSQIQVSPGATTTYTLTATNAAGTAVTSTTTIQVVPLPAISTFAASRPIISSGQSTLLAWAATGAQTLSLSPAPGLVTGTSPLQVSPAATTTYTLTATNAAGATVTSTATVQVVALPTITAFTASPALLSTGQSTVLAWSVTGAQALCLSPAPGDVTGRSQIQITPGASTTYTLTATNAAGDVATLAATVQVVALPVIGSFSSSAACLVPGQPATLSWAVSGAQSVAIAPGPGDVSGLSQVQVTPGATTTYTLTATNAAGATATAGTTLHVVDSAHPPAITLASFLTAGKAGYGASVPDMGPCTTYAWTVANGTLLAGQGTSAITLRAGNPGSLQVGLTITYGYGSAQVQATATVVPAPQARLFAQDKVFHDTQGLQASVPLQPGMTFQWTVTLPGGGVDSGSAGPVLTYHTGATLGAYVLTAQVQNQAGDVDTDTRNLAIVAGQFLKDPSSPLEARSNHTATLLKDGRLLVTGGYTVSPAPDHEDLFDPSTLNWAPVARMGMPRSNHTATLLADGTVLIAGGDGLRSCERYDPIHRTWTSAATMAQARGGHVAVLLPDGRVLVAGGASGGGGASSECFDPLTNAWTTVGAMTVARTGGQAVLLANGKVLVTGGYDGLQSVASADLFDPSTGAWTATRPMGTPRRYHTATLLANGQVLVAGGYAVTDATASAEIYAPESGTWTVAADLAGARAWHACAALADGRVLVLGGVAGTMPLATTEAFDPTTGRWSAMGDLAKARWYQSATPLGDGTVLTVGGTEDWGSNAHPMTSGERFNPATGTWSGNRSHAHARVDHTAILLQDGHLLVVGGTSGTGPAMAFAESLDTVSHSWSPAASMAEARSAHTATLLRNGRVLVVAGHGVSGLLASAEVYDPALDQWSTAGNLSAARYGHTATLLADGRVLVAGGRGDSSNLDAAEVFDPATNRWTPVSGLQVSRYTHTATLLLSGKVLVTGGVHDTGVEADQYLRSTEVFNPATGTWSPGPSMLVGHNQHAALAFPDGKVLVAGGSEANFFLATAESYDPVLNVWTAAGSLPGPRVWHTLNLLASGKALLVGGYGSGDTVPVLRYDPATRLWSSPGSLSTRRYQHTTSLLGDGSLLVVGGVPMTGQESWRD